MRTVLNSFILSSLFKTEMFLKKPECYVMAKQNNVMNKKLESLIRRLLVFKYSAFQILRYKHPGVDSLSYFEKYLDIDRTNKDDVKIGNTFYQLICVSTDNPNDLIRIKDVQLNHILAIFNISKNTLYLFIRKNQLILHKYKLTNINMYISLNYTNTPIIRHVHNLKLKLNIFNGVLGLKYFYLSLCLMKYNTQWVNLNDSEVDPGYDFIVNGIKINVKTISDINNKICIHSSYDKCDVYILFLLKKIRPFKEYLILLIGHKYKKDILNGNGSYIYLNSEDFKKDIV